MLDIQPRKLQGARDERRNAGFVVQNVGGRLVAPGLCAPAVALNMIKHHAAEFTGAFCASS
jgi:hypothetical protein